MIQEQFDINRIIGVKIVDKQKTGHKWLPKKQKTAFFGLVKRNAWHSEGFYSGGHYQECYESGCWDACPSSAESLISYGYLVEWDGPNHTEQTVYSKPYVTVYLESDYQTTRNFEKIEDAQAWVEELKATSGKTFEIVNR